MLNGVAVSGVLEVSTVKDSRHSSTQRENRGGAGLGANTTLDMVPAKLRSTPRDTGRAPSTNTVSESGAGPSMGKVRGRPAEKAR